MTKVEKEIQSDLDLIQKKASREANRVILIWGGLGALCAIILWWML